MRKTIREMENMAYFKEFPRVEKAENFAWLGFLFCCCADLRFP
jgi:hypothetical protein